MELIAVNMALGLPGLKEVQAYFRKLIWIQQWFNAASAYEYQMFALKQVIADMQPYLGETYPLDEQVGKPEVRGYCVPTALIAELHRLVGREVPKEC